MSQNDDRLIGPGIIQVCAEFVDLFCGVIIRAVIPVFRSQAVYKIVIPFQALVVDDVFTDDGIVGCGIIAVFKLMIPGGVDIGDPFLGNHIHGRLGKCPEFALIGIVTAHVAAEAHGVDPAVFLDDFINPGVLAIGRYVIGGIMDVRRKRQDRDVVSCRPGGRFGCLHFRLCLGGLRPSGRFGLFRFFPYVFICFDVGRGVHITGISRNRSQNVSLSGNHQQAKQNSEKPSTL